MGEAGLYGALAGAYGAPVLMASGDDLFIAETRPLFPWATFVQTKRATGQTSGISLSPAQSCAAIRAGVAAALAARARRSRWCGPRRCAVTLRTQTPALADLFCQWPTFERVAPVELRFGAPIGRACGAHAQLLLGDVGDAALTTRDPHGGAARGSQDREGTPPERTARGGCDSAPSSRRLP